MNNEIKTFAILYSIRGISFRVDIRAYSEAEALKQFDDIRKHKNNIEMCCPACELSSNAEGMKNA